MLKVLAPEEMGRADRAAADSGILSFHLMKAAGRAVAEAASQLMGGTYGRRVLVLAGKGNNGGDGLVAAHYLARRGVTVKVLLTDDPSKLQKDARKALGLFLDDSGPGAVRRLTANSAQRELERSDLSIDALVGTGFRGALRGAAAEAAELVNRSGTKVVSVDIPSGVDGATGLVEGEAIRASVTVTLAALKTGLVLHPGAGFAGRVRVADIGIRSEHMTAGIELAEAADVAGVLPPRDAQSHKRAVGKVLIIAGSPGMSGAAILAASAALRTGAGLVWVAAPRSIAPLVEQGVTEAVVQALPQTESGSIAKTALEAVLEIAAEADAVALGPGITTQGETMHFVFQSLSAIGKPMVIDADGINAFAGRPDRLAARNAPTVLTPHSGELARLLDSDVKQIQAEPIEHARRAAGLTGATVLLKGQPTLAAGANRVVAVNTGGPFLASAGTGDVLTGVVATLAAQTEPFAAAWAGAWLHGIAGRLAAGGGRDPAGTLLDRGILASDVLEKLPEAIGRARSAAV